ncbi:MAG: G5 domain-containing protein [Ardenticatenaceae bacterium]|nr:G5 domain-containing protein [Ardenticatenaceae bacterium]
MRDACSVLPSRITHHASRSAIPLLIFLLLLLLAGCAVEAPQTAVTEPLPVTLIADGESFHLTTQAANVRELLVEAGIELGESDEVTPPVYTPLSGGETITVVRVTESIETTTQAIPFARKTVRNESMAAEDPPLIVQAGKDGLQETTIRIVYRDGLEAERWPTQTVVIEEPQDEIVMVGIGAAGGNVSFPGVLAYISDGTAVLLRGESAFPEQLAVGGQLDGRVFSLSPSGDYLLYSRVDGDPAVFNNALYVIETQRSAEPRALGVENVLWADWNPASEAEVGEIAYTTAVSITTPPGWEANNDLWRAPIPPDPEDELEPEQIVEAYAALYSWWGGNFAWSPTGTQIAYSYANEVGLINLDPPRDVPQRVQLQTFTEFDPPGDWVWVPTLAWSPDGRFLAYTGHDSSDPEDPTFANWVVDTTSGIAGRFVPDAGMWAHLHWAGSPDAAAPLAFLRTTDPLDSQRSSYTLWLMDRDGSNARQIYPPANENSYFPRQQAFMAWGPTGEAIAFIFNNDLYLYTLTDGAARRLTEGDAVNTHPTWAPYGTAVAPTLPAEPTALPPDVPGRGP